MDRGEPFAPWDPRSNEGEKEEERVGVLLIIYNRPPNTQTRTNTHTIKHTHTHRAMPPGPMVRRSSAVPLPPPPTRGLQYYRQKDKIPAGYVKKTEGGGEWGWLQGESQSPGPHLPGRPLVGGSQRLSAYADQSLEKPLASASFIKGFFTPGAWEVGGRVPRREEECLWLLGGRGPWQRRRWES